MRDLANARQTADEAAEAQRRASQHNTSLSETSLAEYRSLPVIHFSGRSLTNTPHRKASTSVLAVSER
ncbi:hypothetical protein M405DRAFT_824808 [Rhizopogon salebrosus TDB-379]|nr:hypothetical protein M405DRAFT_824808 [Rhizopogon salebrosus TDB-379]